MQRGDIRSLVETYCLERDVVFSTDGSWTLMDKARNCGAEPDECYVFGTESAERPHLAIEVVWTHRRIDKLEIYRQLGVAEVWYWRRGLIQPYRLHGERYEPANESQILPGLDLALLMRFIDEPTTSQAIRGYRDALQG